MGKFTYDPDYVVTPGSILQEMLEALQFTQKDFAERVGCSAKLINQIIAGKAAISHDMAIKMGSVLGTSHSFWDNLEADYRYTLRKLEERAHAEERRNWLKQIPVKELTERGYITNTKDKNELYAELMGFFGVADYTIWESYWTSKVIAYRKSANFTGKNLGALAAWLRICELKAQKVNCKNAFSKPEARKIVPELRKLIVLDIATAVEKLKEICRNVGIAVVIEPEIKGAAVTGAAKWLMPNAPNQKTMIALNLRGKRLDTFWFTFFHELGHLICDSIDSFAVDINSDDGKENTHSETAANEFASNVLFPKQCLLEFRQLRPVLADCQRFAQKWEMDVSFVIGKLAFEGKISYKHPLMTYRKQLQWRQPDKTTD